MTRQSLLIATPSSFLNKVLNAKVLEFREDVDLEDTADVVSLSGRLSSGEYSLVIMSAQFFKDLYIAGSNLGDARIILLSEAPDLSEEALIRSQGITDVFDVSNGIDQLASHIRHILERRGEIDATALTVIRSEVVQEYLDETLIKHGVETASIGIKDIKHNIRSVIENIDIIIIDEEINDGRLLKEVMYDVRNVLNKSPNDLPVLVLARDNNNTDTTEIFKLGANDVIDRPLVKDILLARVKSHITMRRVFNRLQRQSEHLEKMSITDGLTGLYNKRHLLQYGQALLDQEENQSLSVVIFDIDHFKQINDTHGHLAGDNILSEMGSLLLSKVEETQYKVFRYGGEEFVALLPSATSGEAMAFAEEARQSIETLMPAGIRVTSSFGVYVYESATSLDIGEVIDMADQALYRAKEEGRNQVRLYEPPNSGNAQDQSSGI